MLSLSAGEIQFSEAGIRDNIRADGRERLHYRPFSIETGIITQTNGSARLVLDSTDVMVGIKAEIGEPDTQKPNEGKILVSVECCPSASPEFEGRGATALNVELGTVIQRYLENNVAIDLKQLSLVSGRQCWVLYVDALVLDSSGNLFDALSIAVRAALSNTQIPKVKIIPSPDGTHELELDGDKAFSLPIDNVPVCVTMSRIGGHHIVDATLEEELCRGCRVTFAVNKSGNVCSVQKGTGTISPHAFTVMLQNAVSIGKILIEKLDAVLTLETEQKKNETSNHQTSFGFFL